MKSVLERLHMQLLRKKSVTIPVRVRPQASTTALRSILADGTLKIDLAAPAEDGKANAALVRYLAEVFDVPVCQVTITAAAAARRKLVRITA